MGEAFPSIITIEVVYARPEEQFICRLEIRHGSTIHDALQKSGLLNHFPELQLNELPTGIFGTPYPLAHRLKSGDRIEIYRPLRQDPKAARRQRARQPKN